MNQESLASNRVRLLTRVIKCNYSSIHYQHLFQGVDRPCQLWNRHERDQVARVSRGDDDEDEQGYHYKQPLKKIHKVLMSC